MAVDDPVATSGKEGFGVQPIKMIGKMNYPQAMAVLVYSLA